MDSVLQKHHLFILLSRRLQRDEVVVDLGSGGCADIAIVVVMCDGFRHKKYIPCNYVVNISFAVVSITGAGIDCFIAGQQVGPRGTVVGVDMTPEMVHEARRLAKEHGHNNVSFRLGEIEYLPIADNYADVVISNCVVNLSPDKVRQQCHS